jgi:hypothetical protein
VRHTSKTFLAFTRRCTRRIQKYESELQLSPSFPAAHRLLCTTCFGDISVSLDKLLKNYNILDDHFILVTETMPISAGKDAFVLKQDVMSICEASSWQVLIRSGE